MEFFLSRNSTTNTVLVDASGGAHYKVKTPFKLVGKITTIHKVIRNEQKSNAFSSSGSSLLEDKPVQCSSMTEKSMELAEIHWRFLATSSLRFGAIEFDMSEYMPSQGILRRTRAFHGPDGRPYKWRLGFANSTLEADDGLKTPIARTHRRCSGFIGKSRLASLEIYPAGQHMVDTIVITWCYVETLRREREEAMKHGGG